MDRRPAYGYGYGYGCILYGYGYGCIFDGYGCVLEDGYECIWRYEENMKMELYEDMKKIWRWMYIWMMIWRWMYMICIYSSRSSSIINCIDAICYDIIYIVVLLCVQFFLGGGGTCM